MQLLAIQNLAYLVPRLSLDAMERFFISIINNKHVRSTSILQSLLRASAGSIDVPTHSSNWEVKNPHDSNESDVSRADTGIKIQDEINKNKSISQTKKPNSSI